MKKSSLGIGWTPGFISSTLRDTVLRFLPILLALLTCFSVAECLAAETTSPVLDHSTVPSKGRQQAILTTKSFGRYAISVKSPQGTAVQLVDRMAGPGEIAGAAGEEDGRLDLFLDRGKYRIVTQSPAKGLGKANLEVHAFREKNSPKPPMLVELKPVSGSLDDFEQISYWLEVKERRWVALEAAGRNLADLRLWKDGAWLVDVEPAKVVLEPKSGQPLLACRLTAILEPGPYLLTAYGGKGQPWAEDSKEHPFHLRFGIPALGTAGRGRFIMSPFGTDRWLVPGDATFFRVELPEARAVSFTVGRYEESKPFQEDGASGNIQKNSVPPVAETDVASLGNKAYHLVTVRAEAGQPFILQQFERSYEYHFTAEGDYWISTVNTGHPGDAMDATGILQQWKQGAVHHEPLREKMPELSASRGWARRANLLDTLTVFLKVSKSGTYEILSKGADARFRIEPFFTYRPQNYKSPSPMGSGSLWDLDAGYYVFTAEPVKKGILDVVIRPKGLTDFALEMLGMERDIKTEPLSADIRFPRVHLERGSSYTLYLNRRPEVKSGVVLRPLPIELSNPLPLVLTTNEVVKAPVRIDERGVIRAQAEDGSLLDLSYEGGQWAKTLSAVPGTQTVLVRNTGKSNMVASLKFQSVRLSPETPLPDIPDATLAALPKFPVLSEKDPRFFDLEEGGTATFSVRSDRPGLYRLETTGLLATEGNLRSRTVTSIDRQTSNGVGRNFLVQQYLREGDYQVTVAAQGKSAGHAGLRLGRADLLEGGELAEGIPARVTLPAGRAAVYKFTIKKKGRFHLRSLGGGGGGRFSNCRLENGEGWPLEKPNITADFDRIFEPGKYRLVILPESVESRRVTLLERIPEPPKFTGHGPHALPLEKSVEHIWREPKSGKDRTPDQWKFTLSASAETSVELTDEMEGTLYSLGEDGKREIARVQPGRGWKGKLDRGKYRLDAVCSRKNNRVNYHVGVTSKEMLPGSSRQISGPTVVPISVPSGPDGALALIDLWSYGPADVRARLYDEKGRLVAQNDDRPDDWNFEVTQRFAAGIYTLQVEPVGIPAPGKKAKRHKRTNHAPAPAEAQAEENSGRDVPQTEMQEEQESSPDEGSQREQGDGTVAPANEAGEGTAEEEVEGTEKPPVTLPAGKTTIHFAALKEVVEPALTIPFKEEVRTGSDVHLYPLSLPTDAEFLVLSAHSDESVGIAVEMLQKKGEAEGWKSVAVAAGRQTGIELPISSLSETPARQYRLRVWSADHRGSAIKLTAAATVPVRMDEKSLAGGATLKAVPDITPSISVARVDITRPGVFKLAGVRTSSSVNVPCLEAKGNLSEATGNVLWIVKDIADTAARVDGLRLVISPGSNLESDQGGLTLSVSDLPVMLDLSSPGGGPMLAVATSRMGQPGIRVAESAEAQTGTTDLRHPGRTMAVGPDSAVSVSLNPQKPSITLWAAEGQEDFTSPLDVRIRTMRFQPPDKGILSSGANTGFVSSGSARAFDLPEGKHWLHVALGEGLVGVLSKSDAVTDILWAGGKPHEETFALDGKDADRLTLLQSESGEGRYEMDLLPHLPGEDYNLIPGGKFERVETGSGVLRLRVQAAQEKAVHSPMLHIRGADAAPFLITDDGRVLHGREISVPSSGGTLLVYHKPGLLLLWMDNADGKEGDPWAGLGQPKETDVTLPARVELAGKAQLLRFTVSEPSVLHLRAASPAVAIIKRGVDDSGNKREPIVPMVEIQPDGCSMDIYLPRGMSELGLRALAGRSLYGEATLTSTPATPIGEGQGPEVILPSGGARVFSFQVKRKGPVGIGVRAEADVVEATLLDSSGNKLGTGVVQMPVLEPGDYILILKAPADGPPLLARPALAGVELPGNGPPPDVIKEYIEKAKAVERDEAEEE